MVIIGLGDTGLLAAVRLARHARVIGITTRPCLVSGQELGLRLARPAAWKRISLVGLERYRRLETVERVHGRVEEVDFAGQRVRVEDAAGAHRWIGYDALLIASGVGNGFWRHDRVETQQEADDGVDERAARVAQARHLAIVGGGPSGVSAAWQIRRRHPESRVELFVPGDGVLPGYHPRTRASVAQLLTEAGVVLRTGHRAELPPEAASGMSSGPLRWSTGQEPVDADLVLWTVGQVRPHSGFLPADVLDERGFVRVEPTLSLPGQPRVFAVGDIAATDPQRSSARNGGYALVARNIRHTLAGRPHRMRPWRAPRYRWGSILGPSADGLRVWLPQGWCLRFPPLLAVWLYRWVVPVLISLGIRDFRPTGLFHVTRSPPPSCSTPPHRPPGPSAL